MSHIGNVRAVVDPQYRRKGVARMLIKEIIDIALNIGLAKLRAEFMGEQTQAIKVFQTLGFEQAAVINDYAWDLNGEPHDYVMMVAELRGGEYFAAD